MGYIYFSNDALDGNAEGANDAIEIVKGDIEE